MRPDQLDDAALAFLSERHLGILATHRADGSIHAVPVAFMYAAAEQRIRIIAPPPTVKVTNARRGGRAAVSFVDGPRWATLEGEISVHDDAASIARTLDEYTAKYRPPRGGRRGYASIEIAVDRVMGRFSTTPREDR